jgi:hypothetical protein
MFAASFARPPRLLPRSACSASPYRHRAWPGGHPGRMARHISHFPLRSLSVDSSRVPALRTARCVTCASSLCRPGGARTRRHASHAPCSRVCQCVLLAVRRASSSARVLTPRICATGGGFDHHPLLLIGPRAASRYCPPACSQCQAVHRDWLRVYAANAEGRRA